MKNIAVLTLSISVLFLSSCYNPNLDEKEPSYTNINHAIATIESKYNSSLDGAISESINSINHALHSIDGIEVIGLEDPAVQLIVLRRFPSLNFEKITPYIHPIKTEIHAYKVFNVGIVDLFRNQSPDNHQPSENHTFIDITDRVVTDTDIPDRIITDDLNTGLLGFALDPIFHLNGFFYLHYTGISSEGSFVSRVSRFSNPPSNRLTANPQSEVILLEIPLPEVILEIPLPLNP